MGKRDILSPCKCKFPACDLLAYQISSKIRRKRASKVFFVYKLNMFFDCIWHGSQHSQMTTSFDPDFGEVGDWRTFAPMNAKGAGRNRFLQKGKMKGKRKDK